MNENLRARHWNIKTYKSVDEIHKILKGSECIYRMISHYNDKKENGEKVKEHTHIVLSFKNDRKGKTLINWLKLEDNAYLDKCNSLRQSIRYLIHFDDIEKATYTIDEIVTNDVHIKDYFTEPISDTEKAVIIYEDMEKLIKGIYTTKQFLMLHPAFIYRMNNFRALKRTVENDLGIIHKYE